MNIHVIYIGIDAISIALLVLIAARFLQEAPKHKNTWLVVAIVIGAISYILSARQDYGALIPDAYDADFGGFFPALNLMRNATTAFFMLLCRSIFRDGSPAPKTLLSLLALQLFLEEPLAWLLGPAWPEAGSLVSIILYEVVPSIIQLSFLGLTVFWILSERDADLVTSRRKARSILLIIYVANVVLSLVVERVAMALEWIPWPIHYPIHVAIVTIGLFTSLFILGALGFAEHIGALVYTKSSRHPKVEPTHPDTTEADVARVLAALQTERVYRTAGLSVGALAKHLSLPEYRLRSLIHHHLGFRNFNALLHHYRLVEVSAALADPNQNSTPVLTLALSAGYQSINPFNRAFRDLKAMTPTQFRRHAQKNDADNFNSTPITPTRPDLK